MYFRIISIVIVQWHNSSKYFILVVWTYRTNGNSIRYYYLCQNSIFFNESKYAYIQRQGEWVVDRKKHCIILFFLLLHKPIYMRGESGRERRGSFFRYLVSPSSHHITYIAIASWLFFDLTGLVLLVSGFFLSCDSFVELKKATFINQNKDSTKDHKRKQVN